MCSQVVLLLCSVRPMVTRLTHGLAKLREASKHTVRQHGCTFSRVIGRHFGPNRRARTLPSGRRFHPSFGPHVLMVLAWLVTGKRSFRQYTASALPFSSAARRTRKSLAVGNPEVARLLDSLADEDSLAEGQVSALVQAEPAFQYDHARILTDGERAQYHYWVLKHQVPAASLWFFTVAEICVLPSPCSASTYCSRQVSKTFRLLDPAPAQVLWEDVLEQIDGPPAWLPQGFLVDLCVVLPPHFAQLIAGGVWSSFALPSPFRKGPWGTPAWFQKLLSGGLAQFMQATQNQAALEYGQSFQISSADQLATRLRRVLRGEEDHHSLLHWVLQLQAMADSLHNVGGKEHPSVSQVIELVLLSDMLKNSDDLKKAIMGACRLILPSNVFNAVKSRCEQFVVPDKGMISRFRLTLDVAMMLRQRVANHNSFLSGHRAARFLTWDSSPQFHKDYELILVESAAYENLPRILSLSNGLYMESLEALEDVCTDQQALEKHCQDMADLGPLVVRHALPCVLIGFGAASLSHKVAALAHAVRLEHFSEQSMVHWCSDVLAVISDDGAERLLGRIQPVPVQNLTPHFEETTHVDIGLMKKGGCEEEGQAGGLADAVFEDAGGDNDGFLVNDEDVFEEEAPPPTMSFQGALACSGVHHILDNATQGFASVLPSYEDNVRLAQAVCKLVRRRDTQPKLLARCYGTPLGRHFHQDIRKFRGWINPSRWGTVAFSIPEILSLKQVLVWGWDKARYMRGEGAGDQQPQRTDTMELVQAVDDAVSSEQWWGWVCMMARVCNVLREAIRWCERCSCHGGLPVELVAEGNIDISSETSFALGSCPMRCRRAPDLAHGDLQRLIATECESSAADLFVKLPRTLSAVDRRELLQEFDMARAHLTFYVTAKLSHWSEFPWHVVGIASLDRTRATATMRKVLQSAHPHPILQRECNNFKNCTAKSVQVQDWVGVRNGGLFPHF